MRSTRSFEAEKAVARLRQLMKSFGMPISMLASELGVSRQYIWQVIHTQISISLSRALQIEQAGRRLADRRKNFMTFGERLRAARVSAGMTLKEVAERIGYSWVGVERWEKDQCLPKPGVLWHLLSVYGIPSRPGADVLPFNGRAEPVELASRSHFGASGLPHDEIVRVLARRGEFSAGFRTRAKSSTRRKRGGLPHH